MKKVLFAILTGIILLGACGNNNKEDDFKSENQDKKEDDFDVEKYNKNLEENSEEIDYKKFNEKQYDTSNKEKYFKLSNVTISKSGEPDTGIGGGLYSVVGDEYKHYFIYEISRDDDVHEGDNYTFYGRIDTKTFDFPVLLTLHKIKNQ